jgi:hypothetical protein
VSLNSSSALAATFLVYALAVNSLHSFLRSDINCVFSAQALIAADRSAFFATSAHIT